MIRTWITKGKTWYHNRMHQIYLAESEQAKDSYQVATFLIDLLHRIPVNIFDQCSVQVLMTQYMSHPAPTIAHAIIQLNGLIECLEKDQTIRVIDLINRENTLEMFFRSRESEYIDIGEAFRTLHDRILVLAHLVQGDVTDTHKLQIYQARLLYPLLDNYRHWCLKIHKQLLLYQSE